MSVFEDVKEQCTNILLDEGQYMGSEPSTSDSGCSTPCDAPEDSSYPSGTGNMTHTSRQFQFRGQAGARGSKRKGDEDDGGGGDGRSSNPTDESEQQPGPSKKACPDRVACPYRKRNPFRFNVRDHPACALKSYDMTEVK